MKRIRRDTNVHFVIVGIDSTGIIGNRRSIGGSFTNLSYCDGSADELTVDLASDGSRSNRPIRKFTRRKQPPLPQTSGI